MNRKGVLIFWGPLVTIILILGGIAAYDGVTAFCSSQLGKDAIAASQSAGCIEFWLNRYQTMLTGLAALAAAIFAGAAAVGQLREAKRQSAIGLQPVVEERIAKLDEEIEGDRLNLMDALQRDMQSGHATVVGTHYTNRANELAGQMRTFMNRQPGGSTLYRARHELRDHLYKAAMDITAASQAEEALAAYEIDNLSQEEIAEREQVYRQRIEAMRIGGEELQLKIMNWKTAIRDEQKKLFNQLRVLGEQAMD